MKKLLKIGLPAALLCAALAFAILFKAVPVFAEGPDAEPEVFAEEIKTFLADNNVENLYVQELNLQDEVYSMGSLAGTSENVSLEANNAKEVQDAGCAQDPERPEPGQEEEGQDGEQVHEPVEGKQKAQHRPGPGFVRI